jgi:hypothetical protein
MLKAISRANRAVDFYEVVPGQPAAPNANNQPQPGGTPPAPAPQPNNQPQPGADFDPTKLTGDQIAKVLENPELWKQPRIAELLNHSKEYKTLQKQQSDAENARLAEEGKHKELAEKTGKENASLREQLKTSTVNQAMTNKLVGMGVVDLDAALKLVDRSNVSVDDSGNVTGVDQALEALKTGKAYLFTGQPGQPQQPKIGGPTNPNNGGNQPTGVQKFKRSQLADREFYNANKAEIIKAVAAGMIEDDLGH